MTILSRHKAHRAQSTRAAFTLVELLIGVSLSVALLAIIYSTFLVLARGAIGTGNYAEMSRQSRNVMDIFAGDVRTANGVAVAGPSVSGSSVITSTGITLSYPNYLDDGTDQTSVTYLYTPPNGAEPGCLTRSETYGGTTDARVVLNDIIRFELKFYKAPGFTFAAAAGPLGSANSWAKSIEMYAELRRKLVSTNNTDYIITTRFMMRNTSID